MDIFFKAFLDEEDDDFLVVYVLEGMILSLVDSQYISNPQKTNKKLLGTTGTTHQNTSFGPISLAIEPTMNTPRISYLRTLCHCQKGFLQDIALTSEMGLDASYLTNGYLETTLDFIPGMKDARLRDLPNFLRTTNPDDFMLKFALQETERAKKASAIVLNTFETLESKVLESLQTLLPPIYPIGPMHLLVKHVDDENLKGLESSLWKEEPECLQWLENKEPKSVVYVNFGSVTVMTPNQLVEFSWGLANSQIEFLWIIRPDIVSGYESILPPEFLEETKNRGMLASWCSQEEVLNHPAIGGFLTHSGWNSTLESISSGVPMICWPFFAEQQTNCWFTVSKWDIGMEIDNNVKRNEVESLVRELMVGEKGKEMKKKAMEWKKLAEISAQKPTGSSYVNINKVVDGILLLSKH